MTRRSVALLRLEAFLTLALLVPTASLAQADGLSSEDLRQLRSVGDTRISPDGGRVVYTVTYRDGPVATYSRIHVMDLAAGTSELFPANGGRGSTPRWSPDGERLAFFGSDGERSGLWVAAVDGSEVVYVADVEGTNHPLPSAGERLTWAPDGERIAFIGAVAGPESAEANGDPMVITRYLYKPTAGEGGTRFNDNRRTHVFVADLSTGRVEQKTFGDHYEHSLDWSPTGEEILFVSNREADPDRFFNYDLFALEPGTGTVRRLTRTENAEYQPKWSPDGQRVVYLGTKRGLTSSETTMEDTHVWVVDADGSNKTELGGAVDNRQRAVDWAPDGRSVLYTVQSKGSAHLYRQRVDGGTPAPVTSGPGRVGSWSIADAGRVAYGFSSADDLAQLYVAEGDRATQLTRLNAELLSARHIAEVEAFTFHSFDGTEVEAFLTKPLGLAEGSTHALIVSIHGGPHGQQGPQLDHKAQVYAGLGMATLMINYRGSTGYGQAFADAIFRDQNGSEAKDVLYGTEATVRRYEWIDRERVGVEGGSYGGQLTNWLITQTNRYRAAIPRAGISNLISFNYMAYYHDYLAVEFGAFPTRKTSWTSSGSGRPSSTWHASGRRRCSCTARTTTTCRSRKLNSSSSH